MFLLNIVADDVLLSKSGMLFHKRLPRNFMESMPNVMLFAAGICSRSLVLRSYFTSFLIKYSYIKGGFVKCAAKLKIEGRPKVRNCC